MWAQPASIGQIFLGSDGDNQMAVSQYLNTRAGQVRLRRAVVADAVDLSEISATAHNSWTFKSPEHFMAPPFHSSDLLLVLERSDNVLLGYISCGPCEKLYMVHDLVVPPEYRRLGLGTILLDQARTRADRVAGRPLFTQVRETDLVAQLFLRSSGFTAIGMTYNYYDDVEGESFCAAIGFTNRPYNEFYVENMLD